MINLDIQRYDSIKDQYFEKVYATIKRTDSGSGYKLHVKNEPITVRELVYKLYEFGVMSCLLANGKKDSLNLCGKTKESVDKMEEEQLRAAVRALVLADPTELKAAAEKLAEDNDKEFVNDLDEFKKLLRTKGNEDRKEELSNKYGFLVRFADRAYENMRNQKVKSQKEANITLPELMVAALNIRTCPYCNRGFIGITKGKLLGVQLDHFYSRSKFPFFAVSLFNLVPCCSTCNHIKSDNPLKMVSPFEAVNFNEAFQFTYEVPKTGKELTSSKHRELKLEIRESCPELIKRLENNLSVFRLQDAYIFQEREAEQFCEKMIAYPRSRLEEIVRHFKKNVQKDHISVEGLEDALFREYFTEPSDYAQKPMAKFYRDLYYGLRGWE